MKFEKEIVYTPVICNCCGDIMSIPTFGEIETSDGLRDAVVNNGWIYSIKRNKSVVYCCHECEKKDRVEDEL